MEEVLPDGPGAALGRRVPAQVRQLLVDPLQGHLGSHRSEKAKIQTECRETGLVLKERPAFIYNMYNRVNFCLLIAFTTTSINFQTPTRARMAWLE